LRFKFRLLNRLAIRLSNYENNYVFLQPNNFRIINGNAHHHIMLKVNGQHKGKIE